VKHLPVKIVDGKYVEIPVGEYLAAFDLPVKAKALDTHKHDDRPSYLRLAVAIVERQHDLLRFNKAHAAAA